MMTFRPIMSAVVPFAVCLVMGLGEGAVTAATKDDGFGAAQQRSDRQRDRQGPTGGEQAVSEATESNLAGNRLVHGRIKAIRSNQIEIDIGNPQPLFVPLEPAHQKGQTFKEGDPIIVTLNDHNAVVDYHHPGEQSHHQVVRGKLKTPLDRGIG